jgi:hypothetical protein
MKLYRPLMRALAERHLHSRQNGYLDASDIVHMRYTQGLTYRTIAEGVRRSEDGIRMLILRCLDRIRSEVTCDESR